MLQYEHGKGTAVSITLSPEAGKSPRPDGHSRTGGAHAAQPLRHAPADSAAPRQRAPADPGTLPGALKPGVFAKLDRATASGGPLSRNSRIRLSGQRSPQGHRTPERAARETQAQDPHGRRGRDARAPSATPGHTARAVRGLARAREKVPFAAGRASLGGPNCPQATLRGGRDPRADAQETSPVAEAPDPARHRDPPRGERAPPGCPEPGARRADRTPFRPEHARGPPCPLTAAPAAPTYPSDTQPRAGRAPFPQADARTVADGGASSLAAPGVGARRSGARRHVRTREPRR